MLSPEFVRQEHPYGCAVACLAMVCGLKYQDVYDELRNLGIDVASGERHGITHTTVEQFLGDHGRTYVLKYRWHGQNIRRPQWPVPPFAPLHIVGISDPGHDVVMLADGTVLDPARDRSGALRALPDLGDVEWMLGIWNERA